MATIVDHQINHLCRTRGLVEPYDSDMVNPASIDVTLGNKILVEKYDGWTELDLNEQSLHLEPGEFILAHTAEFVRIPQYLEAVFQLKSSRGREGFEHSLAGYIDPGFSGQITLELRNITQYQRLKIYPGLRIGQLRFMKVDKSPLRPYFITGRYNNDLGAVPSKG